MQTLYYILTIYLIAEIIAIITYIPRMRYWFIGFCKQKRLKNDKQNKFAVIIPAKNESKIIAGLFETVENQTYDKKLYDVFVIVEDEKDPTINLAKAKLSNVTTLVVPNQTKKADALDGCIKYILKQDLNFDGAIIVDADNLLTPNYLEEINNAFVTNADIIIGRKRIKNWESTNKKNRNLIANVSALTYTGVDTMGNKGKSKLGYHLNICGQGMFIKFSILQKLGGYPYTSIVEDYEFGIDCIKNNYKSVYYEYAEIYAEESPSKKVYDKRRTRWVKGYAECDKKYRKELLKLTFKNGKIDKKSIDFLFGVYPLFLIFGISGIVFAIYLGLAIYYLIIGSALALNALLFALLIFAIIYGEVAIYALISVLEDRDINKMTFIEKLKVVLFSPLIMLEYAYIYIKAYLTKDECEWVPTERIEM